MNIPEKYEDVVASLNFATRETRCLKAVLNGMEFGGVDRMFKDGEDACLSLGQQAARIIKGIQAERDSLKAYDEAKERALFEIYALEVLGPYFMKPEDCLTRSGETYVYGQPATAWCAWKACAQSRDGSVSDE